MQEIKTERLTLKPMCREYLATTHEYAGDPENTRLMVFLPKDNEEETLAYIMDAEREFLKEKPEYYEMAVFCGERHIGGISLWIMDGQTKAELGWTINKRFFGNGYAPEAAKAMIDYAANALGIRHFIAQCDTENAPSQRVMEKLGMKLTGEYGGRKNRANPDEERREYLYELYI
jgi:ribosomal-protein-alanine N-acetyltransferase